MKKILSILIFIILQSLSTNFCLATNPMDTNWRSFVYDKQAWELGPVLKLTDNENNFFASGMFGMRFYDSVWFNGIAELQDSLWVPLGNDDSAGIRGNFQFITDIIIKDSLLYVGGLFDTAGYTKVYNLAIWNINSREWNGIGKGINGIVTKIALRNNDLFIGGHFDTLATDNDTIRSNNIAKWDGSKWNSLGIGLNGPVDDMLISGYNLYIVGRFDSVGTIRANHFGIWNDSSETWSSFGDNGPIGEVTTVCKVGNNVFLGGIFDSVSTGSTTIGCKNIVKWNGTIWDSLDNGINGRIYQMIADGNDLFVVGNFIKAINDTLICKNISKWDGSQWEIFGSGANEAIHSIALKGDSIFIGGEFSFTGDTLATNIGLWHIPRDLIPKQIERSVNFNKGGNDLVLNISPNPATKEVSIEFFMTEKNFAEIYIYDISGLQVGIITKSEYDKGWNKVQWNVEIINSGTYICKIITAKGTAFKTFILSK